MDKTRTAMWYLRSYLFMVYAVLILLLLLSRCNTEPETPFVAPEPPAPVLPNPRQQQELRPDPNDDPRRHGGMGRLKITLMWDFYGDIDLHVKEPSGNVIMYNNKVSRSSGRLDKDNTVGGRGSAENIFWQSKPPRGEYKVYLDFFAKSSRQPSSGSCRVYVYIDGVLVNRFDQHMSRYKEKHLITTVRIP